MMLTPKEIQDSIVSFIKVYAQQTHADVAEKLPWLGTRHEVAMNMDRLAKDGKLTIEGWDGKSVKRYSIVAETKTGGSTIASAVMTGHHADDLNKTYTATVRVPYKGIDISITVPLSPQARSAENILQETQAVLHDLGQDLSSMVVVSPIS